MSISDREADEAAAAQIQAAVRSKVAPNLPPTPYDPACQNGSVASCCYAYVNKLKEGTKEGKNCSDCLMSAEMAYCNAMPPLVGADNIRDFIACVAHGILIKAFEAQTATRLLYAAQVAYAAQKAPPTPGRPGRPYASA